MGVLVWAKQWAKDSLWAPPAFSLVLSVAIICAAYALGDRLDPGLSVLNRSQFISLLGVFASSMLAISSFTVSAIVTASSSVAARATPRASQFVVRDLRSQFVLATFVSGFIYSIASIVAVSAFEFGAGGRFLLFAGLVLNAVVVLVAFVLWVDGILKLGLQRTILNKLLDAAVKSVAPQRVGTLGAHLWDGEAPAKAAGVYPAEIGYVSSLDLTRLQAIADAQKADIYLAVRHGDFIDPTLPIAYVDGVDEVPEEAGKDIGAAILLYSERNAETDLRFNLLNLSEVASRALSPGVNDPGSAIAVLDLLLRVLREWAFSAHKARVEEIMFSRLHLRDVGALELMQNAFTPIARDGAANVEVATRLQNVLAALARCGDEEMTEAAATLSKQAVAFSEAAMVLKPHRERVGRLADSIAKS